MSILQNYLSRKKTLGYILGLNAPEYNIVTSCKLLIQKGAAASGI
jgi:hypothetical protein